MADNTPAPTLYLIAHKVRGERAFDVAHRLQIGSEEGWIIPTSGHRAHPFWFHPLEELDVVYEGGSFNLIRDAFAAPIPEGLRDHYAIEEHKPTVLRRTPRPASRILTIDDLV